MKIISQSVLQPCSILQWYGHRQKGDLVGAFCSHPNLDPSFSAPFISSSHGLRAGRGRNTVALMGVQIQLKPSDQLSFFSVRDLCSAAVPITDKVRCPVEREAAWFKLWGQNQPLSLNPLSWEDSRHSSQGHHSDPEQPVAAIRRKEQRGHTELSFAASSHCRSSTLFEAGASAAPERSSSLTPKQQEILF